MKQQIAEIINDFYQSCGEAFEENVPAIAEAIVKLVEQRPVSKVQAMALFIHGRGNRYYVPDTSGKMMVVDFSHKGTFCHDESYKLCSRGDCDHIKAVKLYLENQ